MKTDVVSRRLSHWWYLTVSTEPQGKQETPSKGGPFWRVFHIKMRFSGVQT
jgi:hypothetical protein